MKKLNRKAFTLIELIAVILILGMIALIAVPVVTSIIKDSKVNAFKVSVKNVTEAIEKECQVNNMNGIEHTSRYKFSEIGGTPIIDLKGELPTSGYINIDEDCVITNVSVSNGEGYVKLEDGEYKASSAEDVYTIDLVDFNDFSNWRMGNYNYHDGGYRMGVYNEICLQYVTAEPGATYKAYFSNTDFKYDIKQRDKDGNVVGRNGPANNGTFLVTNKTDHIGIAIEKKDDTSITFEDYRELFENGFKLSLKKVNN